MNRKARKEMRKAERAARAQALAAAAAEQMAAPTEERKRYQKARREALRGAYALAEDAKIAATLYRNAANSGSTGSAVIPPLRNNDEPVLVARIVEQSQRLGAAYEEANWDRLSPVFRRAHNRYRQVRGLSPIPEPKVDRYVPPSLRHDNAAAFDMNSPEAKVVLQQMLRRELMVPGGEGFDIRATPANWIE